MSSIQPVSQAIAVTNTEQKVALDQLSLKVALVKANLENVYRELTQLSKTQPLDQGRFHELVPRPFQLHWELVALEQILKDIKQTPIFS